MHRRPAAVLDEWESPKGSPGRGPAGVTILLPAQEDTVTPDEARAFIADHHRAVMVTRRGSGGLQTSPVTVGVDDDGMVVVSSRETAYKVRNLRRDPRVALCVLSDGFFGRCKHGAEQQHRRSQQCRQPAEQENPPLAATRVGLSM
jgi:hypothetical protein